MSANEVATRYATALYEMAADAGKQELVFKDLRVLNEIISNDKSIYNFVHTPLVNADDKVAAIESSLKNKGFTEEVYAFTLLLAKKGRLRIFENILAAYEARSDKEHGVSRGVVESTAVLSSDERKKVEELVSSATGEKVILTYDENPNLIGGVTAKVGSHTFDDSLAFHLRRLTDELNRRTH